MNELERSYLWQPYPELVEEDPRPWQILDTSFDPESPSGFVLPGERIMGVPLTPEGRSVSRHEEGHVIWSPPKMPRNLARSGFALAVEDARINLGLRHIGQPVDLDVAGRERVLELARGDLGRPEAGYFAARCIASLGTSIETELHALAAAGSPAACRVAGLMAEVRARLERERPEGEAVAPFRSVVSLARWLRRELGRLGVSDVDARGVVVVHCCFAHGGRAAHGARLAEGLLHKGIVPPGRLRVTTAPLLERCAPGGGGRRRWRAAEEGTELRHPWRFAVDQRVFRRRAPRGAGGGSVLVDVSGSMGLSADDVDKLIAAAPGATLVALYSGWKREGELRIVVKDGRRAGPKHLRPAGRGNVVDVPALAWLARQRPPRIWVSDGGVTGWDDQPGRTIDLECRRICRSARIERASDATRAAAILAGGGRCP